MGELFADPAFWQVLNSSLRTYVINLPGQWIGLVIICGMLEQKRKLTPLVWYLALKTLFFILFDNYMNYFFGGEVWVQYPMTIGTFWGALVTCLMFKWTFHGSFIKVITGMNISEVMITMLLVPCIIITNIIQGREVVTDMTGTFHILDLMVGILMFAILAVIYPLVSRFLQKYKRYEFKHVTLMWILLGGYFFTTQTIPFFGLKDGKMMVITMYLLHLLEAVVVIIGIFLIYRISQRKVRRENEFLRLQMHLMEGHYIATQRQIRQMENSRRLVAQQMESLAAMTENSIMQEAGVGMYSEEDRRSVLKRRIRAYLEELHSEYDQLQAGMYCNDWMVDAVLYCQIETAKRQGMEVDCSLQGYDRGQIGEEDLVQILYDLLDYSIRGYQKKSGNTKHGEFPEKSIRLHMGAVKNQLLIEFFGAWPGKKLLENNVTELVEKYNGMLQWKRNAGMLHAWITMER